MRIACPTCNAAYQVPDDQLSEGRVVRCARCGTDWAPVEAIPASEAETVEREPPPAADSLAPELVIDSPRRVLEEEIPIPLPPVLPPPPPRQRGAVLLVLAWLVSLAAVGGAVAGLYAKRERVMQIWPESIRAYAPLGLAGHAGAPSEGKPSEGRE